VKAAVEGATFAYDDGMYTVAAACELNEGRWRCLTHEEGFGNQMQKDCHIGEPGEHVLAWVCFAHGPEVP
jgi:hypothetical protein